MSAVTARERRVVPAHGGMSLDDRGGGSPAALEGSVAAAAGDDGGGGGGVGKRGAVAVHRLPAAAATAAAAGRCRAAGWPTWPRPTAAGEHRGRRGTRKAAIVAMHRGLEMGDSVQGRDR